MLPRCIQVLVAAVPILVQGKPFDLVKEMDR